MRFICWWCLGCVLGASDSPWKKGVGRGSGVNSVESPSWYLGVTAIALQRAEGGTITKNKDRHDVWWENHKLKCFYFSLWCVAYMLWFSLLSFIFPHLVTHTLLPVSFTLDLKHLSLFNELFNSERLLEIILLHHRSTTRLTSVALLIDALPMCTWIFLVPKTHYF